MIDKKLNINLANQYIRDYVHSLQDILSKNIVGIYLFGSLTYDDFNADRSDIDLMVVLKSPLSESEIKKTELLHYELEVKYPMCKDRVEASYTPFSMLKQTLPPTLPRPYYGEGKMWAEAKYGNEWIINLFLLKKYGKKLLGADLHNLIDDIDVVEVQKACIRDLVQEWEPKLNQPDWLDNAHYQSYLVLNLCRIIYTVLNADAKSKKIASTWVKKTYPEWSELIVAAENWSYSSKLDKKKETLSFLGFVVSTIKNQKLYNQI